MNKKIIDQISNILYEALIGESDSEIPKDEYKHEAELLLVELEKTRQHLTEHLVNVVLTKVLHETCEYDFTDYQYENGAFNEASAQIVRVLQDEKG